MIYVAFEARWQGCRADGKRQRRRVQPLLAASRVDQSRENMSELAAWDSFYVIVGSAAGALIGLQFVVVTLIAQRPTRAAPDASAAFGTPTIVHFGAVLLLAFCSRAKLYSVSARPPCCCSSSASTMPGTRFSTTYFSASAAQTTMDAEFRQTRRAPATL